MIDKNGKLLTEGDFIYVTLWKGTVPYQMVGQVLTLFDNAQIAVNKEFWLIFTFRGQQYRIHPNLVTKLTTEEAVLHKFEE